MIAEENTNPEEFEKTEETPEVVSNEKKEEEKEIEEDFIPEEKVPFWKKHFLKLLLLFLLLVSMAWGYFEKQKTISNYETQIKELRAEHIKDLSSTLALAIRSEMIADNLNQVNQYLIQTVKMFDVTRILLADPSTGEVIVSTNKKDEGAVFDNDALVNAREAIKKMHNNHTYTATPIMGLNTQLAVLIIQVD